MRHKIAWYLAHWLGILTGCRGCRGEGYVKDADGNLLVCHRFGCH